MERAEVDVCGNECICIYDQIMCPAHLDCKVRQLTTWYHETLQGSWG
jgi:hypothetical protein